MINVITKSGEGSGGIHAGVEGGSFGTFNQTGGLSGSTGGFHYAAISSISIPRPHPSRR